MKNDPFLIAVNDHYEFNVLPADAQQLDVVSNGSDNSFHILKDGQAYTVEILDIDPAKHTWDLRVNGNRYTVKINDYYDRLIQHLGLNVGGKHKENTLKAPMPGLVLSVIAEAGQTVQKGDPLLILEAMKMENVLKAANDGVIKAIHVKQGAAVDKGALLMEME